MLTVLLFLFTKHFIIDFLLQTSYMYLNKGQYAHPGGIYHAGLHGLGTLVIVILVNPVLAMFALLFDTLLHYHIDWLKVKITKHSGYKPESHKQYWWLLGLDQYLHALTYLAIAGFIT